MAMRSKIIISIVLLCTLLLTGSASAAGAFPEDEAVISACINTGLLPDTSYELGTHIVDTAGNINETWVNATARMLPIQDTPLPLLPMCFYGNVTINGEPAPDGTTILAKIDDVVRGNAIVKNGKYGKPAWNRLIVNGNSEDQGKIIRFYIESLPAKEIAEWHSGDNTRLDLTYEESLINRLTKIDSFHPPLSDDPRIPMYDEWHYFNVMDEEQNLSLMVTLKLNGDIYDSNILNGSSATVVLSYSTPDDKNMIADFYPVNMTEVEFSNETPDLRIYNNTVTLTDEGYLVHVESNDSQTAFDAMFIPFTEPSPLFVAPYMQDGQNRVINWLVASSKMKVDGTLTTSKGTMQEEIYTLENVRGYHDHNWGYWLWQDDIGWDWGQASESKNHPDGNDLDKYAFCFGNVTNNNHTESRGAVLNV